MFRSTKTAVKAAILAPAAGLLVSFAVPAQAATPARAMEPAPADVQNTVTRLGAGVVKALGLNLTYSQLVAQCGTDAGGLLTGLTTITNGRLLGSVLPARPPVDYRLPLADPNLIVTLNKQVRDPLGGMTVTALTIDTLPSLTRPLAHLGLVHDIGIAHCDAAPARHHFTGATSQRDLSAAAPAPAPAPPAAGDVAGAVSGVVGTVEGIAAQLTGLTGAATTKLPVGTLPVGTLPVGSAPVGSLPVVGSVPAAGSLPVGSVPVLTQALPLSAVFGGLPGLAGGALPIVGSGLPE